VIRGKRPSAEGSSRRRPDHKQPVRRFASWLAAILRAGPSAQDLDLEQLDLCVRKALGVAVVLSEKPGGDEHDRYAAEAIGDNLQKAKKILELISRGADEHEVSGAALN